VVLLASALKLLGVGTTATAWILLAAVAVAAGVRQVARVRARVRASEPS